MAAVMKAANTTTSLGILCDINLRSGLESQALHIVAGVARDQLEIRIDPDKGRLAVDHKLDGLVATLDRPLFERNHVLVGECASIGISGEQTDVDRLIERRFGFLSIAGGIKFLGAHVDANLPLAIRTLARL